MADSGGSVNVLMGVSGSVATIKLKEIVLLLRQRIPNVNIKVIATKNSLHFFTPSDIDAEVLTDENEWSTWNKIGDPVLHIELCKWADILVIAPLDANTLAKLANGLCDNLLTCVSRAWRPSKTFFFAPAMNTVMFEHQLTAKQINILTSFGYKCIPPVAKKLACGDLGMGAMASVADIVQEVIKHIKL